MIELDGASFDATTKLSTSHPRVFDPTTDFDEWIARMEYLLQTRNTQSRKQVRQGIVKLLKDYWPLHDKMQVLVSKVNDLLQQGDSLLTVVQKYQVRRAQRDGK